MASSSCLGRDGSLGRGGERTAMPVPEPGSVSVEKSASPYSGSGDGVISAVMR
jgi:hypothetical protein